MLALDADDEQEQSRRAQRQRGLGHSFAALGIGARRGRLGGHAAFLREVFRVVEARALTILPPPASRER